MLNKIWSCVAVMLILLGNSIAESTLLVGLSSLIGIVFVLGVAQGWKHAQLFGAILASFIAAFSYQAGYYGNMMINLLWVIPFSLVGWRNWCQKDGTKKGIKTKVARNQGHLYGGSAVLIGYAIFIAYLANSSMPLYDGLSSALLIIATFLLAGGYKEQWYAWIPYNIIEVFMWFTVASAVPEMLAILAMRVVFLVNSLIGWYNWNKV